MRTEFNYNDGGRSQYFKGTGGDCVTRAISIATGIAGGVLSITGILLLTLPPYPSRIQESIDDLNLQIENLRGGER